MRERINWAVEFDKDLNSAYVQNDLFGETSSNDLSALDPELLRNIKKIPYFKDFKSLVENVLCHSDESKFDLLYDFFVDYVKNPNVIKNPIHKDLSVLKVFSKQVSRDIHKMRAFVRFNECTKDGKIYYIAFHKPDHYILLKNSSFFMERFNNMNWVIFSPYGVISWNQKELFYDEKSFSQSDFPDDPFVNLWKTYFSNIFNPARLKIKAMKNEMPIRYWSNMPETELIPDLIRSASERVTVMKETALKNSMDANFFIPQTSDLSKVNSAMNICRACNLCELNTKAVSGRGSASPRVLILGEAPGDTEEKESTCFVGPAGQLLFDSLKNIGAALEEIYFTNAVKHFNFKQSGNMRIHKTPTPTHTMSCRPWLSKEISLLKPEIIICLGKTAAHSIFGFPMPLESLRGEVHQTKFCEKTFVTYHPARILREQNLELKQKLLNEFNADLKLSIDNCYRQKNDK